MPTRSDGPRSGRAGKARRVVGKLVRRARGRVAVQAAQRTGHRPSTAKAVPAPQTPPGPSGPKPTEAAVNDARATFFRTLDLEADVALAAAATVREQMRGAMLRRARTFAQILQQEEGRLGDIGDICMGIVTARSQLLKTSWRLLTGARLDEVLRVAAAEYFLVGFVLEPDTAGKTLAAVARGELTARADAIGWQEIACAAFAARAEDESQYALGRARAQFDELPERAAKQARTAADWLQNWYGRLADAAAAPGVPAGEIPFAVASFRHPDRASSSRNLGDYLESLAALSHLARRRDLKLTGDADLVEFAGELRGRIRAEHEVSGSAATARLHLVDRDATSYSAVPDGTWFLVSGLLPRPMWRNWADLPLSPRLRPIFTSVHVDSAESLTPEVLDYLRRYGPVGCRDWPTTFLLLAADVPAFFAGALTTTLDAVGGSGAGAGAARRLFVDVEPNGPGDTATQDLDAVRTRKPTASLRDALHRVGDYRGRRRIVTSRLQTYLTARAVGTEVRFAPTNPAERRFDGLTGLDDASFTAMQRRLSDRIADVLGVILSGAPEDEVYARWRSLSAADVAEAEARRADVPAMPPSAFDIAGACATIRGASTVVERTTPAPDGSEINVELSLDGNYKHQLEVVLDSIVHHASRPVRAFVLCRDHTQDDYDRLAALFPSVSFVWLPTDGVDYGPISGLLGYTTVATMDRLLLPDLLPEISRIVHHDLDALCLVDLAELFDVELGDAPLAGRESPLPALSSGFAAFMRQAERFSRRPELGRELLRRTHGRHRFDFTILNAGIMLLNLDRMRADDFGRHFVPFVERFGMNDQAVLNAYAGGTRVEVAPGWNWRPWLEYVDEPKIAHWAGKYKPWSERWVFGKPLWQAAEARLQSRYQQAGRTPQSPS